MTSAERGLSFVSFEAGYKQAEKGRNFQEALTWWESQIDKAEAEVDSAPEATDHTSKEEEC